jgi:hypothetical protein
LERDEKIDGFLVSLLESPRGILLVISPKAARGRLIPAVEEEEDEEVILENIARRLKVEVEGWGFRERAEMFVERRGRV